MSANNDSTSRIANPSSVQKSSGEKATSEQQYTGQGAQEAPDVAGGVGNPDISFSASVRARELRFEQEPQTKMSFWGPPERNSVSVNERENLPEEVRKALRITTSAFGRVSPVSLLFLRRSRTLRMPPGRRPRG